MRNNLTYEKIRCVSQTKSNKAWLHHPTKPSVVVIKGSSEYDSLISDGYSHSRVFKQDKDLDSLDIIELREFASELGMSGNIHLMKKETLIKRIKNEI